MPLSASNLEFRGGFGSVNNRKSDLSEYGQADAEYIYEKKILQHFFLGLGLGSNRMIHSLRKYILT